MKNIAVILAGGAGQRLGANKPKQFLKVAGKTIIEHTVDIFQKHNGIDEIAIVIHNNYVNDINEMVLKNSWTKVKKILSGGKERYESSLVAINAYAMSNAENVNLIFHDAVRPLVSNRIISETINALGIYSAVDVAIPSVDTIIEVNQDKTEINSIPNRNYLNRGQTPQAFKLNVIKRAYALALKDNEFAATDDCGIIKKYLPNIPICVVEGEEKNIKLTYPEDIYLLDKLFQIKATSVNDNVKLSNLAGKVIVVFGGNSGIGKDIADISKEYDAKVYPFSRTLNNTDISDINSVKKAMEFVYDRENTIDYVVNCAAILNKEPIMHLSYKDINDIVDVNYKGMVNVTIASYEYLLKSKGQILQFTSSSYTRGRAFYALYSSTKSAVVNFVQAVAEEWENKGIKVNCINPQRTNTPMRLSNFGIEDSKTLLDSKDVAEISLKTLLGDLTGEVIDIKLV